MRILDRERYWAFLKAYMTCYISLVGLYVVIDAFSNIDEFMKRCEGFPELMKAMGRYYLIHQAAYFDMLGGVISMMAAIFTVTWMQRNNEHLAMLAAGVSTHRAIRPVLVSSVLVSGLAVSNKEVIIPRFAEDLQKSHDDDGTRNVTAIPSRRDERGVVLSGLEAVRSKQTLVGRVNATIPEDIYGKLRELEGQQATYIPEGMSRAPMRGGWLFRGATLRPDIEPEQLEPDASILTLVKDEAGFPPQHGPGILPGRTYFLRTSLTFKAMTRKPDWYQYASLGELFDGMADPASEGTERNDITVEIHQRFLKPLLSLTLLFMTLPLVLGSYGKNMFIGLGMSLGNSAMFYGLVIACAYLGTNAVLPAALACWLPLFAFGLLATWRWDIIRT
ncbi:putative permease YjgP/YjgQ family protein [Aquisphaera giovannonii]|uniref:Putative permease YjgP/YjgQ family protein n=1 Tax=Aquisphaera giovannonii TaxID=406548 RepID=A0A5B9VZF3_9BACT|nr:LptF/LptG family permease [Aquisphaera giovannonii]QEH33703.1 putative permease YjgP/YjgQ family protein [Aquisphaera giovannonii]